MIKVLTALIVGNDFTVLVKAILQDSERKYGRMGLRWEMRIGMQKRAKVWAHRNIYLQRTSFRAAL